MQGGVCLKGCAQQQNFCVPLIELLQRGLRSQSVIQRMISHDLLCPRSIRAKGIQRVRTAAHVGEARKINSCLSQLLIDRRALGVIRQDGVADFFVPFPGDRRVLPKTRVGMSHRLGGHDQGALRPEGAQKRLDNRLRPSDQIAERLERSVQHDGISPLQPQLSE